MTTVVAQVAPIGALVGILVVAAAVRGHAAAGRAVPTPSGGERPRLRRTRSTPTAAQWAAFLDDAAAEVRTGSSLTVARQHALATHPWCDQPTNDGSDDDALVRLTLHSVHTLGGPGAATLDTAAAVLRERAAIRADAAVHSAQARLSARVMTGVPIAFCAWSLLGSASFRRAWLSPVGAVCAAAGGLCNLCGWWWMRRAIARVER